MKNQAATFGEEGFKYGGMSPEMLLQVNEFASNLREGKLTLPVDNRTHDLLKDNRKLQEDLKIQKLTLERYELELGGKAVSQSFALEYGAQQAQGGGRMSEQTEGEVHALRKDVAYLVQENGSLKSYMEQMQHGLSMLQHQQTVTAGGTKDGITAMLLASNETLMKELAEIRNHSVQQSGQMQALQLQGPVAGAGKESPRPGHGHSTGAPPLHSTQHQQAHQQQAQIAAGMARTPQIQPDSRRGLGSLPASQHLNLSQIGGVSHSPLEGSLTGTGRRLGGTVSLQTPQTPQGRALHTQQVTMRGPLPPEEWADELNDLNGQLIECLEQLFEKEEELQHQQELLGSMEGSLVDTKQQLTVLYHDYAGKSTAWEEEETRLKKEVADLRGEGDDLRLKLKRVEEMVDVLAREEKGDSGMSCCLIVCYMMLAYVMIAYVIYTVLNHLHTYPNIF